MRMSSTKIVVLFSVLALRPTNAQTSTPLPASSSEAPSALASQPAVAPSSAPRANPTPSRGERIQQSTRPLEAASDGAESQAADARTPGVQLEDPKPNQGHFVAVGLHGVGAMAFDESRGTRNATFGTGFSLRLGESLTDWLSVSLAFALGSTVGKPQHSLTLGRFGITSQLYFTERWFLQAGFGAAYVQGPDPEDHNRSRGRYGDVYLTGVGRDFYLTDSKQSGGWVITPLLTAEVGPDAKFTTTSLWLGVELSWWTGLTQDKLNLPASKAYTK